MPSISHQPSTSPSFSPACICSLVVKLIRFWCSEDYHDIMLTFGQMRLPLVRQSCWVGSRNCEILFICERRPRRQWTRSFGYSTSGNVVLKLDTAQAWLLMRQTVLAAPPRVSGMQGKELILNECYSVLSLPRYLRASWSTIAWGSFLTLIHPLGFHEWLRSYLNGKHVALLPVRWLIWQYSLN